MAKGMWIVTYRSVADPGKVASYANYAGPLLAAAGARIIARGKPAAVREQGLDQPTILIEFSSISDAIATYDSPDYAEALRLLGGGAVRDVRIVELLV